MTSSPSRILVLKQGMKRFFTRKRVFTIAVILTLVTIFQFVDLKQYGLDGPLFLALFVGVKMAMVAVVLAWKLFKKRRAARGDVQDPPVH